MGAGLSGQTGEGQRVYKLKGVDLQQIVKLRGAPTGSIFLKGFRFQVWEMLSF